MQPAELIKWAKVRLCDLNYMKLPITVFDPNDEEQLEQINSILDWLDEIGIQETHFWWTPSRALSHCLSNVLQNQYEIRDVDKKKKDANKTKFEIVVYLENYGWARIQTFGAYKLSGEVLSGTKSLRKLLKLCPEMEEHFEYESQETNDEWYEKGRALYKDFLAIPEESYIYKDKELTNVYALDFHWAFVSALGRVMPELKDRLDDLYWKRENARNEEERKTIKGIGVSAIGALVCKDSYRKGVRRFGAHLWYDILAEHDRMMQKIMSQIRRQGGEIINLRTDSIIFVWKKKSLPILTDEGSGLSSWNYKFRPAIRYRQHSTSCYEYEDLDGYHVVYSGKCALDDVKPREQWEWGDIYNTQAKEIKGWRFNIETRRFEKLTKVRR